MLNFTCATRTEDKMETDVINNKIMSRWWRNKWRLLKATATDNLGHHDEFIKLLLIILNQTCSLLVIAVSKAVRLNGLKLVKEPLS